MIKAPPVIIALLKTLPDASLDEMPKKIKNAAKTMAMSESAFIIFYIKFPGLEAGLPANLQILEICFFPISL
jgi:hypothetical protein